MTLILIFVLGILALAALWRWVSTLLGVKVGVLDVIVGFFLIALIAAVRAHDHGTVIAILGGWAVLGGLSSWLRHRPDDRDLGPSGERKRAKGTKP